MLTHLRIFSNCYVMSIPIHVDQSSVNVDNFLHDWSAAKLQVKTLFPNYLLWYWGVGVFVNSEECDIIAVLLEL